MKYTCEEWEGVREGGGIRGEGGRQRGRKREGKEGVRWLGRIGGGKERGRSGGPNRKHQSLCFSQPPTQDLQLPRLTAACLHGDSNN